MRGLTKTPTKLVATKSLSPTDVTVLKFAIGEMKSGCVQVAPLSAELQSTLAAGTKIVPFTSMIDLIYPFGKFAFVQPAVVLDDLNTPPLWVPAKRSVPFVSRERMSRPKPDNPVLKADQLVPLLVETKTPPAVPAKICVALAANARTFKLVSPVDTDDQFTPLSDDL